MPVASWGHCLEPLEKIESRILLELKALHEGAWKIGRVYMVFSQHFAIQVMPKLHDLLKVMLKAHLELQAMLIDVQQNNPTWVIGGASATPKKLDYPCSTTMEKWEDKPDEPVDLNAMHCMPSLL